MAEETTTTETTETATTETTEEKGFVDDGLEPEGAETTTTETETTEEDGKLNEDDEKLVKKTVKEALAPFQDTLQNQRVEGELKDILAANPDYKEYEAKIRRFVMHKNRLPLIKQGLPVKTVVLEAIAPHLQEIGAKKAAEADRKAKLTSNGTGTGATTTPEKPDVKTMKSADIQKMSEQIKSGRYKTK